MSHWIINKLLYMTITSSILIVTIMITKKVLGKKLSVRWNYYVWLLIIIQLLIPMSIKSDLSIYNLLTYDNLDNSTYLNADYSKPIDVDEANNTSLKTDTKSYQQSKQKNVLTLRKLIYVIWFIGFIIITLYYLIFNLKLIHKFKRCKCNDLQLEHLFRSCKSVIAPTQNVRLLVSDFINVPSLYGIIRPVIIMPKFILTNKDEKEVRLLLIHELMHLKLRHNVIKGIYLLLTTIYWFNPLIWLGLKKLDEDGELYCDNEVVNFISSDDNIVYGNLIIDLASYDKDFRLPIQAVSFINNKKYIKKRVLNIAYKKSKNRKTRIIGCLITFIMAFTLMTSAKTDTSSLTDRIEQETGIILNTEAKNIINILAKDDSGYISTTHTDNDILIKYDCITGSTKQYTNLFSIRLMDIDGIPKKCVIYIEQLDILKNTDSAKKHYMPLFSEVLNSLFNNNNITDFITQNCTIKSLQNTEETIIDNYKINHIMDGKHKFYISWK
ncbi:M56 family metallopeptidase [Vallitalea guaymasensis]|uniref:M56 family metallopeptidase n=1 Tax=Vallitalea guaymasensis TaxID=1185412 RepID=A0A8J8M706_9FIRM|nr:M56 family metallopeptidase [Vallitalea guaymasensis]QUH27388.1 M56 family metallopeptidase [Vallitalea guaymasensis]